jgi:hypothetical protein
MLALVLTNIQGIAYIISAALTILGTLGLVPVIKRFLRAFKTKRDLNSAYFNILDQLTQDRLSWKETMASWKGTATALRAEMVVLKERLNRVEGELERLIPKYRAALHFIHELRSHIVPKDMPITPPLLGQDLDREEAHIIPHE